MQSEQTPVPNQVAFNPIAAIDGVIRQPMPTMSLIAAHRPWPVALLIATGITFLSGLASLNAPTVPVDPTTPAEVRQLMSGFEAAMRSPAVLLAAFPIVTAIATVIGAGILYLVGRLLGGRGPFASLLATYAYTSVVNLPLVPLTFLFNLGGPSLAAALAPLAFLVLIWQLVLSVMAVRASLELTTGRAIATVLVPLGLLILLACILTVVVIVVVAASTAPLSSPAR